VTRFDVPSDVFEGLTKDNFEKELLFWVRFVAPDETRWQVDYDPIKREHNRLILRLRDDRR